MTQCLVVDEDQAERKALSDVFRRFGFDLSEAPSADAGLSQCRANAPDVVVVTDRIGANSRDFVRRVRRSSKGKPPVVIIYSSNPDTDAIGRMIMDGAAECIVKPFNQELISLKLRQVGLI
jgi:DNA-binding response OmpR family regulator